ncbi:MAG: cob(I)yrinic acid a,c-diamide adenosyltransferase [Intrasporangium sp.]|uniref:cob(I)yrinic acid a,c-diamide adenosyltransferase n=1 Tax=Intrasporangium sp. TaxID=1925024 RepID=UPI002648BBFA|nr:cob(I)yrinic acid a,c-diamide adenosyltransferase [Intrasporangium sp.]MDN5794156.1 cob(I)yrinic acid a,c-diamide adenosyltransferase [Intrasporangium sp.]
MSSNASRIYTKTGDDGTTGRLFGGRIGKDDALVEACGDIDETVGALGLARAELSSDPAGDESAELAALVLATQRQLFVIAADLMANPHDRDRLEPGISLATPQLVTDVEHAIDELAERHPLRPVFIVPGASRASAALDLARGVVRRAERHAVAAARAGHEVSDPVLLTLNRMSDLLYVLARASAGEAETPSHD